VGVQLDRLFAHHDRGLTTRALLLVGPVSSGKSLFVERLTGPLRSAGLDVCGFFQRGVFGADGSKIGYDLVGLTSGKERALARREETGQGWRFDASAFDAALAEVRPAALAVIDEVGPLELRGGGHAAAVERALACSDAALLVVREALADRVERWLSPRAEVVVVRFEPGREEELAARIIDLAAPGEI
jgi:nucleoside-triphosphatase THEP1